MRPLAILLALTSAVSASAIESRQTPSGSCATGVHVIAIGGSDTTDRFALGLLITLATNITAAIPGSDYSSLPYDKVQPEPQKLFPNAIPDGIALLGKYVSEYHAACPDTKIAIIGYSSGAVISSVALCQDFSVPQSLASNTIIANIEYGAQTFNPGFSYDRGTCVSGAGTQPLPDPNSCGNYIPLTESYCDLNDPQCCDGPQSDYQVHFVYPMEYDLIATQFVVNQFKKLGGGSTPSSPSSSSASPSPKQSKTASAPAAPSSSPTSSPTVILPPLSSSASAPAVSSSAPPAPASIPSASASAPSNSSTTAPPGSRSPSPTPAPSTGSSATLLPSAALLNTAFIGVLMLLGAAML